MTVPDARTLIHVSQTVVEVEVIIEHVLENFEQHEKRLLMEVLVEDRVSVTVHAHGQISQKLKNLTNAIALLQTNGVRI